ncbi:NAD-dependent epimerase/dehydratase family protein [Haloarcula sp. GH36]|uniref:NAD-dependent epimerase/dehydratase family protein n=1 Tax=Haloarcula montana TaxID=3111776 RepID=UPI002D777468|nr:NAD-dependent epimerase/dehydratase family protein [Haloarcula sp. GH36]
MTETALVTGGRGRSGRWICDRLAGEYDVVCVDLDHPGWEVSERDRLTWRAADVTDGGEVPAECELEGEQSALSTAKARSLLEWEPEHDWRTAGDAEVSEPSLPVE